MSYEEIFTPELVRQVLKRARMAGEAGLNISDLDGDLEKLTVGYLVAVRQLEIIGGGGKDPYIVRVKSW